MLAKMQPITRYPVIAILSLSITVLDIAYTAIVADLLTLLQGAKSETVISKFNIFEKSDHLVYFLGFLIVLRFILNDQIYLLLNKVIYLVYKTKIKNSIKSRLENFSSAEIFDEPGRAVKNYSTDINIFIGGFLAPIIQLSIDFFVIVGLLVYASFYVTFDVFIIIVSLCSILMLLFVLRLLSNGAKKYGIERNSIDSSKARTLSELPGTWRSLIDLNASDFFIRRLDKLNDKYSTASIAIARNVNITKLSIETFVGLMLVFICVMISGEIEYSSATAAVIVAIFLRILPTINRSAQAIMSIQSSIGALDSLHQNIESKNIDASYRLSDTDKYIDVESCEVSSDKLQILNLKNLRIQKHTVNAITAPSGSGKTVFLKTLHQELRRQGVKVAYIPQNYTLMSSNLIENLFFDEENKTEAEAISLLSKVGFSEPKIKDFLNNEKLMKTLSGGETQRIFIARYLVDQFDYLLLDEVTSALDYKTEQKIFRVLQSLSSNCTIVINSHSRQVITDDVNHLELLTYLT